MNGTVTVTVECENPSCQFARQPVDVELRAWGNVVEWPVLRCSGCDFMLAKPRSVPDPVTCRDAG